MPLPTSIRDTLFLPKEISDFERAYLKRVNRIALWFFAIQMPGLAVVAWFNDTGPVMALLLSGIVMVGPLVAVKFLENPRRVSESFGFTAMLMGGLLVHFGQGPVQIEMHFYFFAMLAMLAIFGNPMAIVVAAATVALHHLALWLVVPRSVFNYDAPMWVVAVHALFVAIESVAAIYIARSFFDNVIGLEKIVRQRTQQLDERNRDMRAVLDNVAQGLLTLDATGGMSTERSAILDRWFGTPNPGAGFVEWLATASPQTAMSFEVAFDQYNSEILPPEVAIDQFPRTFSVGERHFALDVSPVETAEGRPGLLVVISDATAQRERERLERDQRDLMNIVDRVLADRTGFVEFFEEAHDLVDAITSGTPTDLAALRRAVHTLKGNAMLFGVQSIAESCHAIEDAIEESGTCPRGGEVATLATQWKALDDKLATMLDTGAGTMIVEVGRIDALLAAAIESQADDDLTRRIADLKLEPTAERLRRIGDQARRIARRLGRGEIEVEIVDNDLRLDRARWTEFWSAFVHVVRNAADHGIERPTDRLRVGKAAQGKLTLTTAIDGAAFIVRVADDGRGIDWPAVRERATALGVPCETAADLEHALAHDGLSTAREVSEISGRGVGLAAVDAACLPLGGQMRVTSTAGAGTTFEFRFPLAQYQTSPRDLLAAA